MGQVAVGELDLMVLIGGAEERAAVLSTCPRKIVFITCFSSTTWTFPVG
jgi:hypothetical protein